MKNVFDKIPKTEGPEVVYEKLYMDSPLCKNCKHRLIDPIELDLDSPANDQDYVLNVSPDPTAGDVSPTKDSAMAGTGMHQALTRRMKTMKTFKEGSGNGGS